ncbi:DUF350 domain-containing protein [Photobacterium lipolyticum]|uniref:DUF350 domain-containing protein n=1 Tax=Photobacterium lipolyticum TaxID=266810 RepID=A0A2T3MWP7_9GAMM|nr:DUF350 domain-containing protein [Photobacterium lipolyticum]PSW04363.1 hypothetical protein C9I89_13650 [Photobacterium lipolyticum]
MDVLANSLAGLGAFLLYFSLSLIFLLLFKFVYVRFTPHDEWKLVKDEKNISAAIALSGSIIGYCLAVAGAASNSVNLVDFAVWGVVALIAQLIAFVIIRFGFMPKIVERIEAGEVPAGIVMAATSVSVGLLNAACMTY